MLISIEPGIFTMADAVLAADQPAADEVFIKINHNAKFGSLRIEAHNMGYYQNGDEITIPVSPVDGALLTKFERIVMLTFVSACSPSSGFIPGQLHFPNLTLLPGWKPIIVPYHMHYDETGGDGTIVMDIYAFSFVVSPDDRRSGRDSISFEFGTVMAFAITQRLGIFRDAVTQQIEKDTIVTISGSAATYGTNFNAAHIVTEVTGPQTFQCFQSGSSQDFGGGGIITYGYPTMTAQIADPPKGLYRDPQGNIYVTLKQTPRLA